MSKLALQEWRLKVEKVKMSENTEEEFSNRLPLVWVIVRVFIPTSSSRRSSGEDFIAVLETHTYLFGCPGKLSGARSLLRSVRAGDLSWIARDWKPFLKWSGLKARLRLVKVESSLGPKAHLE
ncbi:hypothetical protein GW17_00045332 [Ensete ventricosum]|nr:hypothetical protein GW17_00045332 [Ensete ventricosum]